MVEDVEPPWRPKPGPLHASLRRLLGFLARPVRRARGRSGVVLQPYRGYGSPERIFVIGRVFWQRTELGADVSEIRDILRRIRRRPVRGALVQADFFGASVTVETDADGYFRVDMAPEQALPTDVRWHRLDLTLRAPIVAEADVEVYVPPSEAQVVVVSDIDDTVMHTGVANTLAMLWRLFVQGAESRTVFPGVSHLYRALHEGATGNEANPMLYVSRAPWGLYDVLEEFFQRHAIPVGPILFLREWGISWRHPLPRRATDHKRVLIEAMMGLYADKPFILIGDSGQHDPEIYADIATRAEGRVKAVYIRDIAARGPARSAAVEELGRRLAAAGTRLVLAADSAAIAEDAARIGLINAEAVAAVRARVAERAHDAA